MIIHLPRGRSLTTYTCWSMPWIWLSVRVMKSTLRLEGAIKKIGNFRSNFLLWEMYKQKYLGEIDMIIHFPRGRSLTTYTCWSWIWSSVCVMKSMLRLEGSIEEFGSFEATFFCRHKSQGSRYLGEFALIVRFLGGRSLIILTRRSRQVVLEKSMACIFFLVIVKIFLYQCQAGVVGVCTQVFRQLWSITLLMNVP